MALTNAVRDELVAVDVTVTSQRRAEVATMLRLAGGLHLVGGRIAVQAEVSGEAIARRIQKTLAEVFNVRCAMRLVSGGGLRNSERVEMQVLGDGASLARQTGLVDGMGRPVRGLPPSIVNGSVADAAAVWRGAFMAAGSLTEPGRSSALEIVCPGPEVALALVGAARRLGITAKAREVRGQDRVVLRDGEAIGQLLQKIGVVETVKVWEERRARKEVRANANRLANFDDANLRRSAQAAVAAGARVQRALEILGDDVPEHLRDAGTLRIEHKEASLDELGRLADPPLTKDAIAGRIRRLLMMADRVADERGIPNTTTAVPADILDD